MAEVLIIFLTLGCVIELALLTLKGLKVSGRRIGVLGDMRELGNFAKEEHQKIGTLAAKICDVLVTVGIAARDIVEGALQTLMDEKNIFQFEESREAGKFMEGIIREGDVILIKGSQSIRMERTVEELMEHPENKDKLLVRQDEEWGKR
jgi:UDP-N-acetylmuramoyl-tripeptide--D-alanyl-D-alanine ligase